MPLQYTHTELNDGTAMRLVPAPQISISKEIHRNGNGEATGQSFSVTLEGTILPIKGNPNFAGKWTGTGYATVDPSDDTLEEILDNRWMESLLRKEKTIREAFSKDGGLLEIITLDEDEQGSATTLHCRPIVESVDFEGGQYTSHSKYTISLRTDFLYGFEESSDSVKDIPDDVYNIADSSETWNIEESDEHSYFPDVTLSSGATKRAFIITHNISATGKSVFGPVYDGKIAKPGEVLDPADTPTVPHLNGSPFDISVGGHAWQQARGYVLDKLGTSTLQTLIQKGAGLVDAVEDYDGSEYEGDGDLGDAAQVYDWIQNPLKSVRNDQDPASLGGKPPWDGHTEEGSPASVTVELTQATLDDEGNVTAPASTTTVTDDRIAYNPIDAIGVFNTGSFNNYWKIYNHVRTQSVDEKTGAFSVDETFVIVDASAINEFFKFGGPATEEVNIDVSENLDTGLTEVSINGTITGLETVNPKSLSSESPERTKYANALKYFALLNDSVKMKQRAENMSGYTICNTVPLSKTVGMDPKNGSINYSFSFDDRPSNLLPGARNESVTINDTHPGNMIAEIPVIGRAIGPVLQYLGANSSKKRTLSIDATFNVSGSCSTSISRLKRPLTYLYNSRDMAFEVRPDTDKCYDVAENETWNPKSGAYSYSIEWIYEIDPASTTTSEPQIATASEYMESLRGGGGAGARTRFYIYEMSLCDGTGSLLFTGSGADGQDSNLVIGGFAQTGLTSGEIVDGPIPIFEGALDDYAVGTKISGCPPGSGGGGRLGS